MMKDCQALHDEIDEMSAMGSSIVRNDTTRLLRRD
jgi:hypothetical protein